MMQKKTAHEIVAFIRDVLLQGGVDSPLVEQEAWWMLEKLTGLTQVSLMTAPVLIWKSDKQKMLDEWLEMRIKQKKPLQYILGSVPFASCDILVLEPILIPRPETEEMVLWVIEKLKKSSIERFDILDLCTGSGCIALALAKAFPSSAVIGVDLNPQAVVLAEKNKVHNSCDNVTFIKSDLFAAVEGKKFDIIISNPPYLAANEYEQLDEQVKKWEDINALVAGQTGTEIHQKIIDQAKRFLKNNQVYPQLVIEIGWLQGSVKNLFVGAGYHDAQLIHDLEGRPRWIAASV